MKFSALLDGGGNIDADPRFAPVVTGTWTGDESRDSTLAQTTLLDANANWTVNALKGLAIQANTADARRYLVVSNTATTVTVWGHVDLDGLKPYAIHDARLQSTTGRWTPSGVWVLDALRSPCIDAGNPTSGWSLEPRPNGEGINIGFDGNTAFASKSLLTSTTIIVR